MFMSVDHFYFKTLNFLYTNADIYIIMKINKEI